MSKKKDKDKEKQVKVNSRIVEVLNKAKTNGFNYITDKEILTEVRSVRQLRKRIGYYQNERYINKQTS